MVKILIILVIAFSFEAFGVILLKQGIDVIVPRFTERSQANMPLWKNVLRLVGEWFTDRKILLGLLLETIFFILLQYLLGQRDVSFIWPLTALSFVTTTLAAQFILHERVDAVRWGGVTLILLGAGLIIYGENHKTPPAPAASASAIVQ